MPNPNLSGFAQRVLAIERRKLAAVQSKLPEAIAAGNWPRVAGLAQAAERIANRFMILLDNEKGPDHAK